MEINIMKPVKVQAKTVSISLKIRDEFACTITDQDGAVIKEYEGYVPDFFPGKHYGDYVMLNIDIDTGNITNWRKPSAQEMEDFIIGESE